MKKALLLCLTLIVMLCAGCEVSSSHESKVELNVDSDGKVNTKATSSVYAERVEDGKTINHSATMSVDKGTVKINASSTNAPKSDAPLSYTVEEADLSKGVVKIYGFFANDGKEPIKMKSVTISYTFYDNNGKVICKNESEILPVDLTVNPGATENLSFIINDPTAPDYKDGFDLKYDIYYE